MESRLRLASLLVSVLLLPSILARAETEPRYLPLIREELRRLRIHATCATKSPTEATCIYVHRITYRLTNLDMRLTYSDDSDTIYHFARNYLGLPSSSPRVSGVLRRLMELNWTMLIGKFQWNPSSGEIRLSAVENTDSNFDRKAFRSTIRSFHSLAGRYYEELDTLIRGDGARAPVKGVPRTGGP